VKPGLRVFASRVPARRVAIAVLGLALVGYYVVVEWAVPLPFYSMKYDPEMPYFMNSLAFFKGAPYSYIDHPGTPLEVLGSLLLAPTRLWTRSIGALFVPYHLGNPGLFLALGHGLLALASLTVMLVLALRSVPDRSGKGLLASCGVAVYFFAAHPPHSFRAMTWWSHNSFAFPLGTLLLFWLIFRLRKGGPVSAGTALAAGSAAGLLAAVQIYFAAWGIGMTAALGLYAWLRGEGWLAAARKAAASLSGIALGFFVGFAPVLHRFRDFYLWVDRLLFRQSRYGTGPEGITSPGLWIDNLEWLWNRGPWPFLATGLVLGLLFAAIRARKKGIRDDPGWWALSLAFIAQLAILWAAIGKHPGASYLLGVAAVLPALLSLAFEGLLQAGGRGPGTAALAGAATLAAFAIGMVASAAAHVRTVRQIALAEDVIAREIRERGRDVSLERSQMTILWGYGVPSPCAALRFGDLYTGQSLQAETDSVCGGEWFYDVWSGLVDRPGAYQPLSLSVDWDILIVPEAFRPTLTGRVGEILDTGIESESYGNFLIVTPGESLGAP